ncbi:DUF6924 domain-containing protein [Streptomyces sp. NPDC007856]|uniref:DUF6924 domain-containing protein n=1 Tax=Streptomyces sp. NPDC007856 TaxID=3364781 RepID=UPI0036BFD910
MKRLPKPDDETLLIRTDFSDEEAWQAVCTAITTPNEDEFLADLHIVDDPAYRDLTVDELASLAPEDEYLLIVADRTALTAPGMPLLVLQLDEEDAQEHGRDLRVVAEELWGIENNLRLANMDWWEFVDSADDDGVFLGESRFAPGRRSLTDRRPVARRTVPEVPAGRGCGPETVVTGDR